MIGFAGPMLVEEAAYEGDVEHALAPQLFFTQRFIHKRPKFIAHPTGYGHGETTLLPIDDFLGQPALHCFFQKCTSV